jgi:hypothetical protein
MGTSLFADGERVGTMSDDRIDACFRAAGRVHKDAARVLMGLLGEVERRGIPQRRGAGVVEYAQVQGGLSESQIELARRLDRQTADLPRLRELFQHGRVFIHRLRVVLGVATPALDEELASLVLRLSKAELEAWARDWRAQNAPPPATPRPGTNAEPRTSGHDAPDTSAPTLFTQVAVPGNTDGPPAPARTDAPVTPPPSASADAQPVSGAAGVSSGRSRVTIEISAVLHERLCHEQAHRAASRGRPVTLDELLAHLLDGEDRSRARYTPVVWTTPVGEPLALRTCTGTVPIGPADLEGLRPACAPIDLEADARRLAEKVRRRSGPRTRTRPAEVDRHVLARSGGACEVPGCSRPGTTTHHWTPWASGGTHDPANLSRLCAAHASLADRGLLVRTAAGTIIVRATAPVDAHTGPRRRYEAERRRAIDRAAAGAATSAAGPMT